MVRLTIDGNHIETEEGATVLEAAQALGIDIPTLCHHEGLTPYGACRLCIVDVGQKGRRRIESSCTRPAEDDMSVLTNTDDLREFRRMTAALLLAQCPGSERIRALAEELGATLEEFVGRDMDCVLCGLCTRACQDQIGVSAISFVGRGRDRRVATPFSLQSDVCIGCGACASVCPTGRIRIEDRDGKRYLVAFNTELELEPCADCGGYFATRRIVDRIEAQAELPGEVARRCPACRRRRIGTALRQVMR